MSYFLSWSGGKDSCLAYYKAIQKGFEISHLLNFISKDTNRIKSHGIQGKLIELQAKLIGIPLVQKAINWNLYEQEFKNVLLTLNPRNLKGIIFGDIYIPAFKVQKHKIWAEKLCADLGIKAIEPLWGFTSEEILLEFINMGYEAIIVSIKKNLIKKEWLGKKVDIKFFQYLKKNNIEICGEMGEYHTFITHFPEINKKISIKKFKPLLNGDYWFLNITEFSLESIKN